MYRELEALVDQHTEYRDRGREALSRIGLWIFKRENMLRAMQDVGHNLGLSGTEGFVSLDGMVDENIELLNESEWDYLIEEYPEYESENEI